MWCSPARDTSAIDRGREAPCANCCTLPCSCSFAAVYDPPQITVANRLRPHATSLANGWGHARYTADGCPNMLAWSIRSNSGSRRAYAYGLAMWLPSVSFRRVSDVHIFLEAEGIKLLPHLQCNIWQEYIYTDINSLDQLGRLISTGNYPNQLCIENGRQLAAAIVSSIQFFRGRVTQQC